MTDVDESYKHEKCDRCGAVGQDRRTLFMACLYEMGGLGIPFTPVGFHATPLKHVGPDPQFGFPRFEDQNGWPGTADEVPRKLSFYTLTVCKGCRAAWLYAIRDWFRNPTEPFLADNNDENIPKRQSLAALLADAERLRTDLVALQSRVEKLLPELREAHDQYDNLTLAETPKP